MELHDDDVLSAPPDVLSRVLDGEAVLLDLTSGSYFGLNDVATRAWEIIRTGTTRRALRAALLDEFEVAEETLDADLTALLSSLEQRGLVRVEHRTERA